MGPDKQPRLEDKVTPDIQVVMESLGNYFLGEPVAIPPGSMEGAMVSLVLELPTLRGITGGFPRAGRQLARELGTGLSKTLNTISRPMDGLLRVSRQKLMTSAVNLESSVGSGDPSEVFKALEVHAKNQGTHGSLEYACRQKFMAKGRVQLLEEGPSIVARAQKLIKREEKIRDFFGTSPGLWDLEDGRWDTIPWDGFARAQEVLNMLPSLKDLAAKLGRRWGPTVEEKIIQDFCPVKVLEEQALGRESLEGYVPGNNLEDVLPQELVYLADPRTRDLFLERYADSRLYCREYKSREEGAVESGQMRVVTRKESIPMDQGPVVICLDTSGSMAGSPEWVSKALVLAIAGIASTSQRSIFLVAFSTDIQCIDLSQPGVGLQELAVFLSGGFHGGTDLRPALAKGLELVNQSKWDRADILVVSDFKVPKIIIKKAMDLAPARDQRLARLHGLSIGQDTFTDDLHVFDTTWQVILGRDGRPLGLVNR